jgi:hypothetical protein
VLSVPIEVESRRCVLMVVLKAFGLSAPTGSACSNDDGTDSAGCVSQSPMQNPKGGEDGSVATHMSKRNLSGVAAATPIGLMLGGWLLGAAVHRFSVRTGVSDAEAYGSLPGDHLIAHPMVEWTRGVTVRTTPDRVWPWLAQMGYGRGGWYTPDWVDLFTNRWVFAVKHPFPTSANRLVPEYQNVAVGDLICDGPNYASYFRVQHVDPPHALVYRSIRHPRRGSPIDIMDPESPQRIEQQLLDGGTYVDFTWTLALNGVPGGRTRLLVRTRANYAPPAIKYLSLPLGLFDATYGVAMLHSIASRAETIDSTMQSTEVDERGRSRPGAGPGLANPTS